MRSRQIHPAGRLQGTCRPGRFFSKQRTAAEPRTPSTIAMSSTSRHFLARNGRAALAPAGRRDADLQSGVAERGRLPREAVHAREDHAAGERAREAES